MTDPYDPTHHDTVFVMDPGDVHVGCCVMDDKNGYILWADELPPSAIPDELRRVNPKVVVVESFHLRPNKAKVQSFSKMETSQLIGTIKEVAREIGAKIVEQQPSVRMVGKASPWARRLQAQGAMPGNRHTRDAVWHAIYYYRFNSKNPRNKKGKS